MNSLAPPPECPHATLPAYAHNDYANPRPLLDALALGYRGVEADVVLVGDELRLGHDRRQARRGTSFEAQYLAPLSKLLARCGTLTADGTPFLLTVELKESSSFAYDSLVALLTRYRHLVAPGFTDAPPTTNSRAAPPVEIVLVGWHPRTLIPGNLAPLGRQERLRRGNGRAPELSAPGITLISLDYGKTVGRWWVTASGRRRWMATIRATKAAYPVVRIRAHNVPVDARVYEELLASGVDVIGSTDLGATAALFGDGRHVLAR